jgi:hypothetical protein
MMVVRPPAAATRDIAGAEIVNSHHGADFGSLGRHGGKPDQIRMVEFVGRRRRQPLTRHEQPQVRELLGGIAIAHAAQPRDQIALGRPQRLDREARRAILALQHPVILHRQRIGGERSELHLAADAVRAADLGDADALGHGRHRGRISSPEPRRPAPQPLRRPRPPWPFGCPACALRSLREPRVGLLRFKSSDAGFVEEAHAVGRSAPFGEPGLDLRGRA